MAAAVEQGSRRDRRLAGAGYATLCRVAETGHGTLIAAVRRSKGRRPGRVLRPRWPPGPPPRECHRFDCSEEKAWTTRRTSLGEQRFGLRWPARRRSRPARRGRHAKALATWNGWRAS